MKSRIRNPARADVRRRRLSASFLGLAAMWLVLHAAHAAACPRVVFFDLGNTLLERDANDQLVAMPGAEQTLQMLTAAGVQLGAITNVPAGFTRPMLDAMLVDPSFLDAFDVVVMSSQASAAKPDPRIYRYAHEKLPVHVAVAQTAFVGETLAEIGNSEHAPTSGARAIGMLGIHLSAAAASPIADYTIAPDRLTDIATLVGTLCAESDARRPVR